MPAKHYTDPDVQPNRTIMERTREDAHELLDLRAQFYFDMSGDELIRRWDAGEFADRLDEPKVEHMALFLRLIRDEL